MQISTDQLSTRRKFKSRQLITSGFSEGSRMFVVENGMVGLYRTGSNKRGLMTEMAGPGRVFGNLARAGLSMARTRAVAITDSELSVVSEQDFEHLVRTRPEFLAVVLEANVRRVDYLACRLEETANESVRVRVARMLTGLSIESNSARLELTHQMLAELLGVSRQTVSEELEKIELERHVRLRRGEITLLNKDGLDVTAKSNFACQTA